MSDDHEDPNPPSPVSELFPDTANIEHRLAAGCVALPFLLLAGWMYYVVSTFLDPEGWIGEVFSLVLYDFVFAVGAVGATLLVWSMFTPRWIPWLFTKAMGHIVQTLAILIAVFVLTVVFVLVFSPWLEQLGIL